MAGCPLCMEDMDVTDKNFRPCKCGYQICLFCYNKIKDNHNGACPACRCCRLPTSTSGAHHRLRTPLHYDTPHPRTSDDMCVVHRTLYDEANAVFVTPDPSECVVAHASEICQLHPTLKTRALPRTSLCAFLPLLMASHSWPVMCAASSLSYITRVQGG